MRRGKQAERRLLEAVFVAQMGFAAETDAPRMLSQKLCAMRLRPADPLQELLAEYGAQEEYLRAKRQEKWLARNRGTWRSAGRIDWNALPDCFVLRPCHLPEAGRAFDKAERGWKKQAIAQTRFWLKRSAWDLPSKRERSKGARRISTRMARKALRIARREYVSARPAVCAMEDIPARELRLLCFHGSVRALYWAEMPQTLFDPSGARLMQQGPALSLRPDAAPGSLGELCTFAGEIAKGFAFMRIDMRITQTGALFAGLRFFEDIDFLRALPREIDLELGSMLKTEAATLRA